jgi:hypothetical protein
VVLFSERGVDCGLGFVGYCLFVVGVEGRVGGVDCVCTAEPPCSSGNHVGAAGAAALASALEKNTTLHTFSLFSEFVVLWFCFGRRIDCGLCFVGYCLFVVGVERRVGSVDCVCVTEPPCY